MLGCSSLSSPCDFYQVSVVFSVTACLLDLPCTHHTCHNQIIAGELRILFPWDPWPETIPTLGFSGCHIQSGTPSWPEIPPYLTIPQVTETLLYQHVTVSLLNRVYRASVRWWYHCLVLPFPFTGSFMTSLSGMLRPLSMCHSQKLRKGKPLL